MACDKWQLLHRCKIHENLYASSFPLDGSIITYYKELRRERYDDEMIRYFMLVVDLMQYTPAFFFVHVKKKKKGPLPTGTSIKCTTKTLKFSSGY